MSEKSIYFTENTHIIQKSMFPHISPTRTPFFSVLPILPEINLFLKYQPLSQHVRIKYQTNIPGTPAKFLPKIVENKISLNRLKRIDPNRRSAIIVLEVKLTRS